MGSEAAPPSRNIFTPGSSREPVAGAAETDSDVDLMVVMPAAAGMRRKTAVEIYQLLGGMGISKDIVIVTPEEVRDYRDVSGTLIYPAFQEGKVLYDRAA